MPALTPAWLDELSLRPGPPWLAMGTHGLRGSALAAADGPERDHLRGLKEQLLASAHDEVAIAMPGAAAAVEEAAQLVSGSTGQALDNQRPPLEAAALQVPEDLLVLVHDAGSWVLAAGVVCFPSHWSPVTKLGLSVAEIHAPVPRYEDELRERVDRFLDHLAPGHPVWRRNWTVHASPALYAPRPVVPTPWPVPEDHWLRSERQALVPLPRSAGILFTVRTQQAQLACLRGQPAFAGRLAATLRSTPPDLVTYRFHGLDVDAIAGWLEAQAANTTGPGTPLGTGSPSEA